MVEQLNNTGVLPAASFKLSTPSEHAMNLIVFDYLRKKQMHYTLSVFASECASIRCEEEIALDEATIRRHVMETFNIHNLFLSSDSRKCARSEPVLDIIVQSCVKNCNIKLESKSSQNSTRALAVNSQVQTDHHHQNTSTQTSQDTENESLSLKVRALNEEIMNLKCRLDEARSALLASRHQPINPRTLYSQPELANMNEKFERDAPTNLIKFIPDSTFNSNDFGVLDSVYFEKRIRDAEQYFKGIDTRLNHIDYKFQRIFIDDKSAVQNISFDT